MSYKRTLAFGAGKKIGPENYVVYRGKGNQVTVTNLKSNTLYEVCVYEFNEEGKKPMYLLGGCATAIVETTKN